MNSPTTRISGEQACEIIKSGEPLKEVHIFGTLDLYDLYKETGKCNDEIRIESCYVEELNVPCLEFLKPVWIMNSHFKDFKTYSPYVFGGLLIDNCEFESYLCFEAGGHNINTEVAIQQSVFKGYVSFLDTWFQGPVKIVNNHFQKGTNLLGNLNTPYSCKFDIPPIINANQGAMNLDGEGDRKINTSR